MLGISLSFYKKPLKFVPVHLNSNPIKTLDLSGMIVDSEDFFDKPEDLEKYIYRVPLRAYKQPDFESLCKIRLSTFIMMDESVEKLFEKEPHYLLIRKIASSIWRWGYGRAKWNEIVRAYNCIRGFNFNHPDFKVRLDYSTHYNEKGYSEYTRTYLDGVFAFLLYYKNQHVMTIGFSVLSKNRILIQQVQLKSRQGNRWLYKLSSNYLEYVLDSFFQNFPRHSLYLVDGDSITKKYIKDYSDLLDNEKNTEYRAELKKRLDHVKADSPRLVSFYNNIGAFKRSNKPVPFKNVDYHKLEKVNA